MLVYHNKRSALGAIADKIRGTMTFFALTENGRELQGLALINKQLLLQKQRVSYSELNFKDALERADLTEAQREAVFKPGSLLIQIYGAMFLESGPPDAIPGAIPDAIPDAKSSAKPNP